MTISGDARVADSATVPSARGTVEAIHISPAGGAQMRSVASVRAIAGIGLAGDRYALGTGHYAADPKVDREITLIAGEELDRLAALFEIDLAPGESRRNVTTRGIDLNALVGRRFRIGSVQCVGTRLCEPCTYLQGLLGRPVLEPLVHRGGLRARIRSGGEIRPGDEIVALD